MDHCCPGSEHRLGNACLGFPNIHENHKLLTKPIHIYIETKRKKKKKKEQPVNSPPKQVPGTTSLNIWYT